MEQGDIVFYAAVFIFTLGFLTVVGLMHVHTVMWLTIFGTLAAIVVAIALLTSLPSPKARAKLPPNTPPIAFTFTEHGVVVTAPHYDPQRRGEWVHIATIPLELDKVAEVWKPSATERALYGRMHAAYTQLSVTDHPSVIALVVRNEGKRALTKIRSRRLMLESKIHHARRGAAYTGTLERRVEELYEQEKMVERGEAVTLRVALLAVSASAHKQLSQAWVEARGNAERLRGACWLPTGAWVKRVRSKRRFFYHYPRFLAGFDQPKVETLSVHIPALLPTLYPRIAPDIYDGLYIGEVVHGTARVPFFIPATPPLNPHKFVLGVTGAGKSTTLVRMAIELWLSGRRVIVLDPHGDFVAVAFWLNKPVYLIGVDYRIDIFACKYLKPSEHITKLTEILREVLNIESAAQMVYLHHALEEAYKARGLDLEEPPPPDAQFPTLADVLRILEARATSEKGAGRESILALLRRLKSLLQNPAFSGDLEPLNVEELLEQADFAVIDLSSIITEPFRFGVATYSIIHSLYEVAIAKGRRREGSVFVFIDEVQNFCRTREERSPLFLRLFQELRKYGIALVVATQLFAGIYKGIVQQCATRMIMQMLGEEEEKARKLLNLPETVYPPSRLPRGEAYVDVASITPIPVRVRVKKIAFPPVIRLIIDVKPRPPASRVLDYIRRQPLQVATVRELVERFGEGVREELPSLIARQELEADVVQLHDQVYEYVGIPHKRKSVQHRAIQRLIEQYALQHGLRAEMEVQLAEGVVTDVLVEVPEKGRFAVEVVTPKLRRSAIASAQRVFNAARVPCAAVVVRRPRRTPPVYHLTDFISFLSSLDDAERLLNILRAYYGQ